MLHDESMVIALIPARGGSKGIARKNLIPLGGKPLILHTIEAALGASRIDKVWVSSDDPEILSIAAASGIGIIHRPAEFADDFSSAVEVVEHFIECLPQSIRNKDPVLVYLQPTSPFRNSRHIDEALGSMLEVSAVATMSVVALNKIPYKAFKLDDNGFLQSIFDERLSNSRRQDLPLCYYPNGAIYAFKISTFIERKGFPSNGSIPYIMSDQDSIDIDNMDDLTNAQFIMDEKNG